MHRNTTCLEGGQFLCDADIVLQGARLVGTIGSRRQRLEDAC
jgi:hypothetical protein